MKNKNQYDRYSFIILAPYIHENAFMYDKLVIRLD
jgi:hypothetical protein